MPLFTKDAGRFLKSREADTMTGEYRERKVNVGLKPDEFTRSEYFGINQVMALLEQPGCIGLRIHHAKRWEDTDGNPTESGKGQLKPRVLLTGVDATGHDMPIKAGRAGLKDGDADEQVLGDGYTCPRHCTNEQ